MYTNGCDAGHDQSFVIVNVPSFCVTTEAVNIGVDIPATVVVFTEYNWIVAPEMGCCPPCTFPDICGFVTVEETDGEMNLLTVHPVIKTQRQLSTTNEKKTLRLDTAHTSEETLAVIGPGRKQLCRFFD
jgi:hypothetical protein